VSRTKGFFSGGCKRTKLPVGARSRRWQQEGRFGLIEFASDALHRAFFQSRRIWDYRHGISFQRLIREHVDKKKRNATSLAGLFMRAG
jgi:hypothetical protein